MKKLNQICAFFWSNEEGYQFAVDERSAESITESLQQENDFCFSTRTPSKLPVRHIDSLDTEYFSAITIFKMIEISFVDLDGVFPELSTIERVAKLEIPLSLIPMFVSSLEETRTSAYVGNRIHISDPTNTQILTFWPIIADEIVYC